MSELPAMKDDKGIPTLYVKGEPFFILGGEIHNSSASSISYMKEQLWTALQQLNGLDFGRTVNRYMFLSG